MSHLSIRFSEPPPCRKEFPALPHHLTYQILWATPCKREFLVRLVYCIHSGLSDSLSHLMQKGISRDFAHKLLVVRTALGRYHFSSLFDPSNLFTIHWLDLFSFSFFTIY